MIHRKYYYLVTLRKSQVKEYVSWEELTSMMVQLENTFTIRDYCFEAHGVYRQLHCHLLIESDMALRFKFYSKMFDDYILHFRSVDKFSSLKKVSQYIHKHCNNHSPEQIEQTRMCNYFKYHYGF